MPSPRPWLPAPAGTLRAVHSGDDADIRRQYVCGQLAAGGTLMAMLHAASNIVCTTPSTHGATSKHEAAHPKPHTVAITCNVLHHEAKDAWTATDRI